MATKKGAKTAKPRVRKTTKRQKKQLDKKTTREASSMPSSFHLVSQVYDIFRHNWRKLLGIVIVYLLLNVVFASGFGAISSSINSIKTDLQGSSNLSAGISSFGALVGSSGAGSSQTSSFLQALLIVIESLAIIWALRQLLAGNPITVKETYYRSMMPLIPFSLVIGVIILQLLPLVLGTAVSGAILPVIFNSGALLNFLFVLLFVGFATWSLYMISSSIFALYIVTLPDMEPIKALRSAKNLVKYRRWPVLRKVLFLPIFILAVMGVICVPLILWATALVAPVFYFLSMAAILFAHSYLYSLYRSLLD